MRTLKIRRLLLVFGGILLWATVLRISYSAEHPVSSGLEGYGGRFSDKVSQALQRMNEDLHQSKGILEAGPDMIRLIKSNDQIKEYCFAHQALWCDHYPVVSGVNAFHFEYRSSSGDRLIRPERNLRSVDMVCYTLHLSQDGKDILTNQRILLRSVASQVDHSTGLYHIASIQE